MWKGQYIVVMTLGKALPLMSNLFLLMLMVMLIFALMGMQLFGGVFNGFEELPWMHFDSF